MRHTVFVMDGETALVIAGFVQLTMLNASLRATLLQTGGRNERAPQSRTRSTVHGPPSGLRRGGETTVLAHYRLAGYCGTGMKPPDELGAWCCFNCHEKIYQRTTSMDREFLRLAHAEGVLRTMMERLK